MGARSSFRTNLNSLNLIKIGTWLRLEDSTPVSGEWQTVNDVLNGVNAVQTNSARKPASSSSSNSLPTSTFDGSDMWKLALGSTTYNTSILGISFWVLGASLSTSQYYWSIFNNDTSGRSVVIRQFNGAIIVDIYIGGNTAGRSYTTVNSLLSTSSFRNVRVQLDMTKTDECDTTGEEEDTKVRIFVDETARALTASDIGVGGVLSALRIVTGFWIIGALNDSSTPTSPALNGTVFGPNAFIWLATPTSSEASIINSFEVPVQ